MTKRPPQRVVFCGARASGEAYAAARTLWAGSGRHLLHSASQRRWVIDTGRPLHSVDVVCYGKCGLAPPLLALHATSSLSQAVALIGTVRLGLEFRRRFHTQPTTATRQSFYLSVLAVTCLSRELPFCLPGLSPSPPPALFRS
jgi:hypothetical protein